MKILAIIISFNGAKWLQQCLSAITEPNPHLTIMVIDNNSTDESSSVIGTFANKVRLILLPENIGFGQAANIGLRAALMENFDYAFLLNQDAIVESGTAATLLELATRHQVDILSPLHYNAAGLALDPLFARYLDPRRTPRILQDMTTGQYSDVYPTRFVNAAAWLLSRRALQTVGGFDPMLFHYGEDNDYLYRAALHHLSVAVTPLARIFHHRPPPLPLRKMQAHRTENAELVQLKNPSAPFIRALLLSAGRTGYRVLRATLSLRFRNAFNLITGFFRLAGRLPSILKNRRLISIPNATFLTTGDSIHEP